MATLDRLSVRNMLARLVKFSSGKGGRIVSSILDHCAEIEAEEARKRVVTAEEGNGRNPVGINDVQAVTGTKGGE
ncbi:hypothetical protein HF882_06725 [Victivallis vadensis]|uniref:Uncharacterized protein n=1 Tax=Victivallis vadensis TaxID=172901 RepID=A0A848B042_9BACT|nr:hypothetical protein [Victivallis vadensis]NMD86276.1 hypothetical protein [Victivallis vadensis]